MANRVERLSYSNTPNVRSPPSICRSTVRVIALDYIVMHGRRTSATGRTLTYIKMRCHHTIPETSAGCQMKLLCAVFKEIYLIRSATDQLREVQTHAPSDVACECLVVEATAVIREIAETSLGSDWTMMLEKLRLHGETSSKLSTVHSIAHIAEHHIVGVRHLVNTELIQESPGARLRYAVREGAGVDSRPRYDLRVSRILPEELIIAVLHVEVLVLRNARIVWNYDSAQR